MTHFVSYAQNGEDVLLWRVLGHIQHGFYIDVGANDPVEDSVTKAFYDRGWHGINIEPVPAYHATFVQQRPHDINLQQAVGEHHASHTLYEVPQKPGWATLDPQIAERHRALGMTTVESTVQVCPLSDVCAKHVRGDIHFLKVDVEGFEASVLRGMDFQRWRPWVLVVEATIPNSRDVNFQIWEPLLLAAGYQYACFDGLNRYYVAAEQANLLPALQVPANVFDHYHSIHYVRALQERDHALALNVHAAAECNAAVKLAQQREQELNEVRAAAWRGEQALQHALQLAAQVQQAQAGLVQAQAETIAARAETLAARGETLHAWEIVTQARALQRQAELAHDAMLDSADAAHAKAQAALEQVNAANQRFLAAEQAAAHAQYRVNVAEQQAQQALQQMQHAQTQLHHSDAWAATLNMETLRLRAHIAALQASTSWRITAPLRRALEIYRRGPVLPRLWGRAQRTLRGWQQTVPPAPPAAPPATTLIPPTEPAAANLAEPAVAVPPADLPRSVQQIYLDLARLRPSS